MQLRFTKMHGCGNDYIYINCFEHEISSPETLSIALSDRRFGIGGDGLILICPSKKADAKMRMFNADGSEGKMCGNGIRCVGKYLYDNRIIQKNTISVETLSGVKELQLSIKNGFAYEVSVDMGKAEFSPNKIPVDSDLPEVIDLPVKIAGEIYKITCVSMGNPHCVVFLDEIEALDLSIIGPKFENNPLFPERINTEFIKVIDAHTIIMRVWERGSGETLACGTGACASAVAAVLNGYCKKGEDIKVLLRGRRALCQLYGQAGHYDGACHNGI